MCFSQTKTISIEDAILRGKTTLAPKKLPQLMWVKGSHDVSFIDIRDSLEILVRQTTGATVKKDVVTFII